MVGFDDHANTLRSQMLGEPAGHLHGETFLCLEVSCEQLHDSCQLGQAEDVLGGQVANVCNAMEREEVVLAERGERNVPYQYQLVVSTTRPASIGPVIVTPGVLGRAH